MLKRSMMQMVAKFRAMRSLGNTRLSSSPFRQIETVYLRLTPTGLDMLATTDVQRGGRPTVTNCQ